MIDWPTLLAGAVLALLLGALFSFGFLPLERVHERAKEKREAHAEWLTAASELELLIWNPEATSAVFFTATKRLPLDPMRRLLGPDDFRLLDGVQGAFDNAEGMAQLATDAAGKQRLAQGLDALRTACVEFSNRVRLVKSEQYTRLVHREARQQLRTDLLRHPVQTMKRERHNRKTRQTQQDG